MSTDSSLRSDWQQARHSVILGARFRARQANEPELKRFADAGALVRFMRAPRSRVEKDAVLRALLSWARDEPLGARVVLETIRPGLLNLSGRLSRNAREKEELRSIVLLCAWEVIRRYPLGRRPRRVAANLLLDTLKAALAELGRESEWSAMRSFAVAESEALSEPEEIDRDVDGLLERAAEAGALSPEEAELILSSRFDGVDLAELARAAGISYNAMKVRRQRAERRLIVFLGYRPVPRGQQNRPSSLARVSGAGPLGPVG
ncbi:MAG TPA: sigma-70 family RNA polymerase sigma factor [Solirubrobacteraceae bacterium]|nr:sigma-70 family RNA polymerase sigma factor [Solirubrobacteraceae bacterium]